MAEQTNALIDPPTGQARRSQARRLFLDMARRRARPGTGSAFRFLEHRMASENWPDMAPLLGDIPWAVAGGVATRAYMPERTTQDLDILIAQADAELAHARLRAVGLSFVQTLSIGGTVWQTPEGTLIDLIESDEPWTPDALRQTETDTQGLPVLSLPFLALMKVQSGRTQDLADVSRMLGLASEHARQAVRLVFKQWLPDALEDLESLIVLGDMEVHNA